MSKTQKTPKPETAPNAAKPTVGGVAEAEPTVDFDAAMAQLQELEKHITKAVCDVLNTREGIQQDADLNNDLRDGEFALAAVCYAMTPAWRASKDHLGNAIMRTLWPLPLYQFEATPEDRRSELVRAAALLIAEVERMDQATNAVTADA